VGGIATEDPSTPVHGRGDRLRFAFYGRMSTIEYQDRASSCRWQRAYADDLTDGHGRIVAEFFDVGVSRRLSWPDRPEAARVLAAVADPAGLRQPRTADPWIG
jgi:site-specific DNA recombinase